MSFHESVHFIVIFNVKSNVEHFLRHRQPTEKKGWGLHIQWGCKTEASFMPHVSVSNESCDHVTNVCFTQDKDQAMKSWKVSVQMPNYVLKLFANSKRKWVAVCAKKGRYLCCIE